MEAVCRGIGWEELERLWGGPSNGGSEVVLGSCGFSQKLCRALSCFSLEKDRIRCTLNKNRSWGAARDEVELQGVSEGWVHLGESGDGRVVGLRYI